MTAALVVAAFLGAPVLMAPALSESPSGWSIRVSGGDGVPVETGPVAVGGEAAVAQQRIGFVIHPGPLTISPASVTVRLHRAGGGYAGSWGPVWVIDARGTLVGWTASVSAPPGVVVSTDRPAAVTGRPSEVAAGEAGSGAVMRGVAGGGGGTFVVSGQVSSSEGGDITLLFDVR